MSAGSTGRALAVRAARTAWRWARPLPRLDRWAPSTELRVTATDVRRAAPPAIDAHNHLGRWLTRGGGWMVPDVGALLEAMDATGLRAIVNVDGRFGAELSANIERYDLHAPGRFVTLCHLDLALLAGPRPTDRLIAGLRESADRGARGVKVWKDLGRSVRDERGRLVLPDDERLVDVWHAAAELGLPVYAHVADPPAFFRPSDRFNERIEELRAHPRSSWHRSGLPSYERLMDAFETAVSSAPGTTWVGAHVASRAEDLQAVEGLLAEHANLLVDTAGRAAELGRQPRAAKHLVERFPDRVLFGTDVFPFSIADVRIYLRLMQTADEAFAYSSADVPPFGRWTISGLDLGARELAAVYRGNAERLFPPLASTVS